MREHDCYANNKKNGDYYECPRLSLLQMMFDYKENGGKKDFLANPMHQYRVSQCREHDYHAKKNNGYYYEYPSLSHFMDEL